LARRQAPELFRLAVAVVGQDGAADATQDALLRAWQELPRLRDPDAFGAWLRRILVNRCRDLVRARRGVRLLSLDDPTSPIIPPAGSDPAPATEQDADLQAALGRLTVDQRTLLALHYALDLPIREVARTLGVPDGTAKTRLNAALVALRRSLLEPDR
jgi:RNA polymerase sigma-70 factor (ECF subfamily)